MKLYLVYLYIVIGTVALMFVTGQGLFIRPHDDAKELLLYGWLAVIAILVGCTSLLKSLQVQKEKNAQMGLLKAVYIYLVYMLIHPILAGSPVAEGVITWGQSALWFLGIASISRLQVKFLQTQIVVIALTAVVSAIIGRWIYPNPRMVWPIGHISYFADFLMIGFIFFSGLCWIMQKWWLKVLWGVAAVNCLVVLIWASTRSPIVALLILYFAMVIAKAVQSYHRESKIGALLRPIGMGVGVVVVIGILLYLFPFHLREQPLVTRFTQLISDLQDSDAADGNNRVNIWRVTTQMALNRPLLGWGYGNFRLAYPPFAPRDAEIFNHNHFWLMHPHNEILNQWVSGGIVGLLLWCNMVIQFFRVLWRVLQSDLTEREKRWAILAGAGSVSLFLVWQFDTSYEHPLLRFSIVPLIALILNLDKADTVLNYATGKALWSRWRPGIAGILILASSWFACGAEISGALILSAEKDSVYGVRSKNVEYVLKYFPNSQEILNRVGGIKVRLNEMYQAKAFFERSLQAYPGVPMTYQNLILIYRNLGENKEATLLSEQYKKIFPRAQAL